MKFNFSIRGLFLLTTFASVLAGIGLWFGESPIMVILCIYLMLYAGLIFVLYIYRYRQQIRDARTAWRKHKLARTSLNEEIARKRDSHPQPSGDQAPSESS